MMGPNKGGNEAVPAGSSSGPKPELMEVERVAGKSGTSSPHLDLLPAICGESLLVQTGRPAKEVQITGVRRVGSTSAQMGIGLQRNKGKPPMSEPAGLIRNGAEEALTASTTMERSANPTGQQASVQLRSGHSGCNQVGEILDLNGSPFPAKGNVNGSRGITPDWKMGSRAMGESVGRLVGTEMMKSTNQRGIFLWRCLWELKMGDTWVIVGCTWETKWENVKVSSLF